MRKYVVIVLLVLALVTASCTPGKYSASTLPKLPDYCKEDLSQKNKLPGMDALFDAYKSYNCSQGSEKYFVVMFLNKNKKDAVDMFTDLTGKLNEEPFKEDFTKGEVTLFEQKDCSEDHKYALHNSYLRYEPEYLNQKSTTPYIKNMIQNNLTNYGSQAYVLDDRLVVWIILTYYSTSPNNALDAKNAAEYTGLLC